MMVSNELFEAYLRCNTKAYLQFFAKHKLFCRVNPISEWQRQNRAEYSREYVEKLFSKNPLKSYFSRCPLNFDDVPWNNNNAEHAVKAFGRGILGNIDGRTSEQGIKDYLVLLSIYQTCEYRGIDFLQFLRSGETRLSGFSN